MVGAELDVNDAVERELISRNPFAKLKSTATARGDAYYVTPSEAVQVLEACPNLEWRVLFALCRYGGLRCLSETHAVTWRDVDWENRRLHVYGKKTGKHREMPVVPKLYRILSEAFEMAADGAEQIVTLSTNNLHRTLEKILERAGVERWGDLFQVLRAFVRNPVIGDVSRACNCVLARAQSQGVPQALPDGER